MYRRKIPVEVSGVTELTINISADEAWRILCQALGMKFICEDDEHDIYLKAFGEDFDPYYDEPCVCYKGENGEDIVVSSSGNKFAALCTIAVHMFPNVEFRHAPYIYRYDPEKED